VKITVGDDEYSSEPIRKSQTITGMSQVLKLNGKVIGAAINASLAEVMLLTIKRVCVTTLFAGQSNHFTANRSLYGGRTQNSILVWNWCGAGACFSNAISIDFSRGKYLFGFSQNNTKSLGNWTVFWRAGSKGLRQCCPRSIGRL
jgi:hypothetical protein